MKHTKQNIFTILTITCLIFALTACGAKQEKTVPSPSVPEITNQDASPASGKTETKKKTVAADKKDATKTEPKEKSQSAQKAAVSENTGQSQKTGTVSGDAQTSAPQTNGKAKQQGNTTTASGSTKPASSTTGTSGGGQTGTQPQTQEPQTQEPHTQEPQTQEPVYEEPGYCKHTNTHYSYAYNIGGWTYPKYTCPHCGQSFYNNGDSHAHWLEETGGEWGEVWLSAPESSYYIEFTVLEDVSREEAEEVGRQYAAMHPELECVGICGWYTNHTICDDCGKVLD